MGSLLEQEHAQQREQQQERGRVWALRAQAPVAGSWRALAAPLGSLLESPLGAAPVPQPHPVLERRDQTPVQASQQGLRQTGRELQGPSEEPPSEKPPARTARPLSAEQVLRLAQAPLEAAPRQRGMGLLRKIPEWREGTPHLDQAPGELEPTGALEPRRPSALR